MKGMFWRFMVDLGTGNRKKTLRRRAYLRFIYREDGRDMPTTEHVQQLLRQEVLFLVALASIESLVRSSGAETSSNIFSQW